PFLPPHVLALPRDSLHRPVLVASRLSGAPPMLHSARRIWRLSASNFGRLRLHLSTRFRAPPCPQHHAQDAVDASTHAHSAWAVTAEARTRIIRAGGRRPNRIAPS